ncbi:MAG: phosphoenolpyruvate--protein phosphotransferase [Thermoguttaceae bacterium]|nr:phosphoenolpyruvate--protein phosphotransferase [Thermoguttaceae bacterium]
MKIFQGIPVSPGVSIGPLAIVDSAVRVRRRKIEPAQVERELERLATAFPTAQEKLKANRDAVARQLGNEYAQIFEAHLLILSDPKLRVKIETCVRDELNSAERAVEKIFDQHADLLRGLQDAAYAERANDIVDVKTRLLGELLDASENATASNERPTILCASNLTPSAASNLDPTKTLGIVAETGGLGSHTAIVATALQIPTVLGVGSFVAQATDGATAIVDGGAGRLILEPTDEMLRKYEAKRDALRREKELLETNYASAPAQTQDGVAIKISGNIEFPYEADECRKNGAHGVGLYRTEFLYLSQNAGELPDEETHFQAYRSVAEKMEGRPVVIRTFDLGADKLPEGLTFASAKEPNPFMGLRSIRLSLRNTEMFRVQLRAILRASVFGKIRVMFPLVSTITEFRQAKMIFRDVCEELQEENIPFDPDIPLGIMVETPATALMLELFVHEVDFFSVGTNDLLQYTMAVDRSNKDVSFLYEQESPALIRLIKRVVDVAKMYGKPVSLCGQMGSSPANALLLLGLGLRSLSVAPGMILQIKRVCGNVTIKECEEIAQNALFKETSSSMRVYLQSEFRRRFPETSENDA